jgi:hypothetical protein
MKTLPFAFIVGSILAGTWPTPAPGHSWYPKECCDDKDCAPVESVTQLVPAGGGMPQIIVTSKYGRAIVPQGFPVRESKDGRMHVCMRYSEFGTMEVICLFVPPHV